MKCKNQLKKGMKKELVITEPEYKTPFEVGKKYFFRTVTFHLLGKVAENKGKFIKLEDASWIADSGRFMQFIKEGKTDRSSEIEPVGKMFINTNSIVDAFPWKFYLPTKQK